MADGKSDIFARNGNESDDHEWDSLVDLVEWFQHSLSIQEPTQPREYLYRRIKNQRNEDIAEWEETRRLETTQRTEQLISQFRQIREDKLGIKVPDEVFNEEFKLWENLFLQLNQKVRIDGDQFAASSFSSWHSKHLERYLPETIYRPLSHSPSLLPQPLWKSLRMRISHSFRVLYRMIDQMSIPTQPGQTGLHQLRDLNVNETVVRMFIDAWLPFVLDTIGGGSVFCVEGAEESDVVDIKGNATISLDEKNPCCCAVEYKVPASEQLLSSGALDYFFFTSNDNSDELVSEVSSVTVETSCSKISQSSSSVQTQVSTSTVTVSSSIGKTIAQASSTLTDVLSTPTKIVRSFSRIVRTPNTPKYTSKDSVCLGVLETKRGSDSYLTQGSVQSIIQLLTLQGKFASRSYVLRDSDTDKGDGKPPVVFGVASTGYRFQFYVAKDYIIEKSDVLTLDTWDDLHKVIGIIRSLIIMCRK